MSDLAINLISYLQDLHMTMKFCWRKSWAQQTSRETFHVRGKEDSLYFRLPTNLTTSKTAWQQGRKTKDHEEEHTGLHVVFAREGRVTKHSKDRASKRLSWSIRRAAHPGIGTLPQALLLSKRN